MDKFSDQKRAVQFLYPVIEPFDQRVLSVGQGHQVYVEQCGNPDGMPVVVCHGGPGGGSSPAMRRYFDPHVYRIILFDQRGCGRSRPYASCEDNTTWHLVADMEKIRETLNIDKWILFGGSWGATLALVYAQTHPERVRNIVLRGVFLMTQSELDWFYAGGAGKFWPELWGKFCELVPEDEHDDLIKAYHKRLFSGNRDEETRFARMWSGWENALASVQSNGAVGSSPGDYARAFARLENHYFLNGGFLHVDGQIMTNMERIKHIPGVIVQGRYDMICPPQKAYELHQAWPESEMIFVRNAGHALSEPGISFALVNAMNAIAEQL